MLTHLRCTIAPSIVDEMIGIKNETEIQGLQRAFLRDGASFVKFLAWLDDKISQGYQISEWEAAFRLEEFRRKTKNYMGPAYESISAAGPNAGMSAHLLHEYRLEVCLCSSSALFPAQVQLSDD